MQRDNAPGTEISVVQSSGTSSQPSSRAARAGNSLRRSAVTVKIALMIASVPRSLAETSASSSSRVADRIASGSSASTVVAPRSARTRRS